MQTDSTSAALKNKTKSMFGMSTIGHQRMVVAVALLRFLLEPHRSNLKYYQVVAQAAHQVVTSTTGVEVKVAIME
jgi:hypothetical protein